MVEVWALYISINCAAPRLKFREFYSKINLTERSTFWAGQRGQSWDQINKAIADGLADYIDYAERYRDQCGK